jgi:hypothetical protein
MSELVASEHTPDTNFEEFNKVVLGNGEVLPPAEEGHLVAPQEGEQAVNDADDRVVRSFGDRLRYLGSAIRSQQRAFWMMGHLGEIEDAKDSFKAVFSRKEKPAVEEAAEQENTSEVSRVRHLGRAAMSAGRVIFTQGAMSEVGEVKKHLKSVLTGKPAASIETEGQESKEQGSLSRTKRIAKFAGRVAASGLNRIKRPKSESYDQLTLFEEETSMERFGQAARAVGRNAISQFRADKEAVSTFIAKKRGARGDIGEEETEEQVQPIDLAEERRKKEERSENPQRRRIVKGAAALALLGGVVYGSSFDNGVEVPARQDTEQEANNLNVVIDADGEVHELADLSPAEEDNLERMASDLPAFRRMITWNENRVDELLVEHSNMDRDVAQEIADSEQAVYFTWAENQNSTVRPSKVVL